VIPLSKSNSSFGFCDTAHTGIEAPKTIAPFKRPICQPEAALPAAPRHLKENPCVDARDILNFSLIHILGYDDDWHYWFQTCDLDPHQVPRGLSAIDAALRGDGIFLGRRPFIDTYLKSGQLAEVFQKPQTLNATYYLRQNKTGNKTRNADRVALWLHDLTKGTD